MVTYTGTSGNDTFQHRNGLDSFDGLGGIDTIDFTKANGLVNVDLGAGTAFIDATAARPIKLMPMGASLTRGYVQTNPLIENGGYRTELYKLFQADGHLVNFVGTQKHGPADLPDLDHQGSPGQQIDWMTPRATEYLNLTQPDGVLLLMGTNDVRSSDTVATVLQQMSELIDTVAGHESRPTVFVASLPPIDPRTHTQAQIDKLNAFNAALPDLVAQKKAQGADVVFVSMAALTLDDISDPPNDTGVHATPEGYKKIASIWYDALKAANMVDAIPGESKVTDKLANIENVVGSRYYDHITGDWKANVIHGLGGNDLISASGGDDWVYGGSGDDRLMGGGGNDHLFGGDGNDRLAGDKGADVMTGGAGADVFILRPGESDGDWITDFEEGIDSLSFMGFSKLKQSWEGDTLVLTHASGVERVKVSKIAAPPPPPPPPTDTTIYGTEAADSMKGDAKANVMRGLGGDDSISSYDGDDILYGGSGNDRLMGGAGNDKMFGEDGDDRLAGDKGADEMTGGAGADVFILRPGESDGDWITDFEEGIDSLSFMGFSNLKQAWEGDTLVLTHAAGVERVKVTKVGTPPPPPPPTDPTVYGTEAADSMKGDSKANIINGLGGDDSISSYEGDDILHGGEGNDRLMGGAGNDKLFGDAGDDRLAGDKGADEMTGGAGADAFILRPGETTGDVILDFETGIDKIELRGFGGGAKLLHGAADEWTVTYSGGSETFKIAGVTSLAAGDYLFI